ncbi:glycosyltransferase family A protein [Chelativorans sp. YIM 93263]|uniref:glycosyltransferase family A protein n=1 Tax=Chelativorans sp. YIM 93263 TaxID=2906648 RepID=UPI0023798FD5|nr:glycosyltransferase family A protein [Chelativorans sp. YIM 93263]
MTLPFTFAIALLPRAYARNWTSVERLLGLTLSSVFAQSDQDFHVVIAGHDRPSNLPDDPRVIFLQADWPAEPVRPDNLDRGRKAYAINAHVLERGGGLLMFLDADDWVDARLVEVARSTLGPEHSAGVIDKGYAVDYQNLRAAPLPHTEVFDGEFHRVCGSSVLLSVQPDHPDPLRRDPYQILHEHYRVLEIADEAGLKVARLPVSGCYLVNTSDSHSEVHGPYAEWRRLFNEAVNRVGKPIDERFLARFGLANEQLHADLNQSQSSAAI